MTHIAHGLLFGGKQPFVWRGMFQMAGQAASILVHRFMGNFDGSAFFSMTAKAQLVAAFSKQNRVFGGMRFMTDGTLAFLKGLVLDITPGHKRFGFVTLETKPAALAREVKRIWGLCICVALFTVDPVYEWMGTGFHKFRLHR